MFDALIFQIENNFIPNMMNSLGVIFPLLVVVVPLFLIYASWNLRAYYMRRLFIIKAPRILLEIKIPKEVFKSPAAMEVFLYTLAQTGGESNPYQYMWQGKSRSYFSLEICSFGGAIKFFIWTEKKYKNIIEAALYAQYPNVEIYEADDYTKNVFIVKSDYAFSGSEFITTRKTEKDGWYPIKTYMDYNLQDNDKEEYKIDPIYPMIEFLATIKQGEQIWFQIVIKALKDRKPFDELVAKSVSMLLKRDPKTLLSVAVNDKGMQAMAQISKAERDTADAIHRNASKSVFEVGMRALYVAKKDKFNSASIGAMMGIVKQFGSNNLNSFKPNNGTSKDDYPWSDFMNIRTDMAKREALHAYKLRCFFNPPYEHKTMYMTSEEVATIFHLPGKEIQTPTFARLESRKVDAPANLPIG
jgi:hypothetical protein